MFNLFLTVVSIIHTYYILWDTFTLYKAELWWIMFELQNNQGTIFDIYFILGLIAAY